MSDFYLLSKPNCGLCQQALLQVHQQPLGQPVTLAMVDISDDPALLEEYANLVPVLIRAKDDAELRWPFQQLMEFLSQ